jgi:hypothetical protein
MNYEKSDQISLNVANDTVKSHPSGQLSEEQSNGNRVTQPTSRERIRDHLRTPSQTLPATTNRYDHLHEKSDTPSAQRQRRSAQPA